MLSRVVANRRATNVLDVRPGGDNCLPREGGGDSGARTDGAEKFVKNDGEGSNTRIKKKQLSVRSLKYSQLVL